MRNCKNWGKKLKGSGYRLTTAREVIINLLANTEEHLSAEDIYMMLHPDNPAIGLTTIYKTLELLDQAGIAYKFEFGHGKAKYELAEEYSNKKHHHHFICKKCRKVVDYAEFIKEEKEYIEKTEIGLQNKYGFDIDTHIIQFYGTCPDCKTG